MFLLTSRILTSCDALYSRSSSTYHGPLDGNEWQTGRVKVLSKEVP